MFIKSFIDSLINHVFIFADLGFVHFWFCYDYINISTIFFFMRKKIKLIDLNKRSACKNQFIMTENLKLISIFFKMKS